jgi:hypothetical protein
MHSAIRHQIHRQEELLHNAFYSALLSAGSLLLTLLVILVLFFGVFAMRAT